MPPTFANKTFIGGPSVRPAVFLGYIIQILVCPLRRLSATAKESFKPVVCGATERLLVSLGLSALTAALPSMPETRISAMGDSTIKYSSFCETNLQIFRRARFKCVSSDGIIWCCLTTIPQWGGAGLCGGVSDPAFFTCAMPSFCFRGLAWPRNSLSKGRSCHHSKECPNGNRAEKVSCIISVLKAGSKFCSAKSASELF